MTLNEIPKPPAVCTKPLRGFVFPRYARPHQFLGGSAAPVWRSEMLLFVNNIFVFTHMFSCKN